jgi:hypothetical protein
MIYEANIEILSRLMKLTEAGILKWIEEETSNLYSAEVGSHKIYIEFLYLEAVNRAGADKQVVELYFPGYSCCFSSGTQGYCLICEILAAAFHKWKMHIADYKERAFRFLDEIK